mmetsp:Transcript_12295/g.37216  ORF Transcript_12295/g.37216 Transcript_12295/m.37216 type:complete len:320 (+) Transcript_12295:564-1523(+)
MNEIIKETIVSTDKLSIAKRRIWNDFFKGVILVTITDESIDRLHRAVERCNVQPTVDEDRQKTTVQHQVVQGQGETLVRLEQQTDRMVKGKIVSLSVHGIHWKVQHWVTTQNQVVCGTVSDVELGRVPRIILWASDILGGGVRWHHNNGQRLQVWVAVHFASWNFAKESASASTVELFKVLDALHERHLKSPVARLAIVFFIPVRQIFNLHEIGSPWTRFNRTSKVIIRDELQIWMTESIPERDEPSPDVTTEHGCRSHENKVALLILGHIQDSGSLAKAQGNETRRTTIRDQSRNLTIEANNEPKDFTHLSENTAKAT